MSHIFHLCIFTIFLYSVQSFQILYPSSKPYIKMDVHMKFSLQYEDTNINETASYDLDGVVKSGGDNKTNQWVTVSLAKFKDNIDFIFYYVGNNLTLKMVYNLYPKSHWSDADGDVVSADFVADLQVQKGSKESYFCQMPVLNKFNQITGNSSQTLHLIMEVTLAKMQAFGLNGMDFGRAVECDEDKTPTLGNYTLTDPHDKTCFKLSAQFEVDLNYTVINGKKKEIHTTKVILPQGTVADGHCTDTNSMHVTILFYDGDFNLTFRFNKTSEKNYHVFVSALYLDHNYPEIFFPGSVIPPGRISHLRLDGGDRIFRISKGSYYRCLSDETFAFKGHKNDTADLHMANFRYIAFSDGHLTGKNFEQCTDDIKINNTVPIAVGAALGALIIIVLIAYLIGRRRTPRGYESV